MKVVIRVDASIDIGAGHVMRCLTLADELCKSGAEVIFICRNLPDHMENTIKNHGHRVILLSAPEEQIKPAQDDSDYTNWLGVPYQQDADETTQAMGKATEWLVVDHYGIDYRWHQKLREKTQKILVIDDLADRQYDADILLDQTYDRNYTDYQVLNPDKCTFLVGSQYALLRPEFVSMRLQSLQQRSTVGAGMENILISLGSTDPENITATVLEGIVLTGIDFRVNVVLGKNIKSLKNIKKQLSKIKRSKLLIDADNMAELMAGADIAIGSCGTTSWERCCLGLPALTITLADNQQYVTENLARIGAIWSLGKSRDIVPQVVKEALLTVYATPNYLRSMSLAASKVCDGRGLKRVALTLMGSNDVNQDGSVRLRLMEAADESTILNWQRAGKARCFSRNPEPPNETNHRAWMEKKLSDPRCFPMIISRCGVAVGLLRFDHITENDEAEISILVAPEYQGRGIAVSALKLAIYIYPKYTLWAEIHPENKASLKMCRCVGFKPSVKERWYKLIPRLNS